jgi:hypothetical protein
MAHPQLDIPSQTPPSLLSVSTHKGRTGLLHQRHEPVLIDMEIKPFSLNGLRQRFVLYPHIASPTIARRQHLLGVFTKP